MIIQDIDIFGTSAIEFLRRSKRHWRVREQIRLGVTLIDPVFIEDSEEDKVVEQHFMEAQITQKDAREDNIVEAKEQLSTKVQVEVQQAIKVQVMAEAQRKAMEMERQELEVVVK